MGNFEYCAIPLQLGHLAGNCFHLLMRNVLSAVASAAPVDTAAADGSSMSVLERQVCVCLCVCECVLQR